MFDGEIRFGTCSALVALFWGASLGLLLASWWADVWALGFAGMSMTVMGACMLVLADNNKTRRVVRAVAREIQVPVRSLRD